MNEESWEKRYNNYAYKEFEEMRQMLINNPDRKETSVGYFGYMVRRGNELFKVVDFGHIHAFILSALSLHDKKLAEKVRGLKYDVSEEWKAEWLKNDPDIFHEELDERLLVNHRLDLAAQVIEGKKYDRNKRRN